MTEEPKKNWRDYYPPMIPIYFIDYEALKMLLERDNRAISKDALTLMKLYYEEYQMTDKLLLVEEALRNIKDYNIKDNKKQVEIPRNLINYKFSKN